MLLRRSPQNTKGQTLMIALSMLVIMSIAATSLIFVSVNERKQALRYRLQTEAFYLAEGGIENAISAFTAAIADYSIARDIPMYNVTTTYTTFGNVTVNATITRLENAERSIAEGTTNILVRNYDVNATARHPADITVVAVHHQIIARRLIPTFQHLVFYQNDLEILPGANMNLNGRIHSNRDIYIDADGSATVLTVNSSYFHSAGDIFNQRKDSGAELPGEVTFRVNATAPSQYANMTNLDCDNTNWTTDAVARWNGTVQSAVHGVTELAVPSVASIQPTGYYADNADVVIVNDQVRKGGSALTPGVHYPAAAITNNTSLYNNREGKYIKTTNINIKLLAGGTIGNTTYPNILPSNGLLYATRDDAGTSYEPAIRLINASQISCSTGLTVASNDPVYIQGNFNTVDETPASVISDSLNVLSNNWNDSRSTSTQINATTRAATNTTVNCAFISGILPTTPGTYAGGLENYPRLHEYWTGTQLNIKGSFVALWNSSIGTGAWVYGAPQYTAPIRNWYYNANFSNTSALPPFTPCAVEAQRIAWWKEQ